MLPILPQNQARRLLYLWLLDRRLIVRPSLLHRLRLPDHTMTGGGSTLRSSTTHSRSLNQVRILLSRCSPVCHTSTSLLLANLLPAESTNASSPSIEAPALLSEEGMWDPPRTTQRIPFRQVRGGACRLDGYNP